MYKYMIAAALMATPVFAADMDPAATPTSAGQGQMSLEQMKARMAGHHEEMVKERDARRSEMDAKMDKCYQAGQAAKSAEEMKKIHADCRKEGEAMHEKMKADREARMKNMKEKRADWKAKKAEMKAGMGTPAAPAGN
jgi:exonuclease VII large subunit